MTDGPEAPMPPMPPREPTPPRAPTAPRAGHESSSFEPEHEGSHAERMTVLQALAEGKFSVEDALKLLDRLER